MKRITEIAGCGNGRDAVLVGGGHSTGAFNFKALGNNCDVMSMNDSLWMGNGWHHVPDFLLYYDANMLRVLAGMKIEPKTKVIGYNNSYWPRMDYDYRMSDLVPCRMNYCIAAKALYIAVEIMKYSRAFLVGVDFYTKEVNGKESSHFQGEQIGAGKKYSDDAHYKTHLQNLNREGEFEALNFDNVFNCNPQSKLKKYAHGMPY